MKLIWNRTFLSRILRTIFPLTLLFLGIEFFDELHYTIQGAALPAIRSDLGLGYAQIGLLLGLPYITAALIEPVIMLLGDTRLRKLLIVGGGLLILLALGLTAGAQSFPVLLAAFLIAFPASGAFVTLSQAALMDQNPGREAQMMARWTAAGSLGNLIGPLALAAGFSLAFGWRWAFTGLGVIVLALVILAALRPIPQRRTAAVQMRDLWGSIRAAFGSRRLIQWLVLLEFSDLLLDKFTEYVPLYFTDVAGAAPAQASLLLTVLMAAGLASDLLLIPLLERIPGRKLVRLTALAAILIYAAWLAAPWLWAKIVLLVLLPFSTTGWYSVLQGEAYAALPGRPGAVAALGSLGSLAGGGVAWLIGWAASQVGLQSAMWLLIAGPLVLALFVPREGREVHRQRQGGEGFSE